MARDVVMVNGLPGSGKTTLGPALAATLGGSYLAKDAVKEALAATLGGAPPPALGAIAMNTVWAIAAVLPGTVVIDSWWFRPRDLAHARAGVARSGATACAEVWCDVPPHVARARFVARRRPADVYADADRLATEWDRWAAEAQPLTLGPVIRVDTTGPVDVQQLSADVRAALRRGDAH